MRKIVSCSLLLFLLLRPFSTVAQFITPARATALLRAEQVSFLGYIDYLSVDSNILYRLSRFVGPEADSIHQLIMADTALPDAEKAKAIQSLVNFMGNLSEDIALEKFETYDIPGTLESYKGLLKALLYHTAYTDLLRSPGPRGSQLLASAFWQYDECAVIDDIAMYKRVASSPGHILQFLESRPGFRFADSLLVVAAAHDPLQIIACLLDQKNSVQEKIRGSQNIYLQQIVSLAEDRNVSDLLPFIVPLAEKRISPKEIVDKRKDLSGYFQLLVNTLKNEGMGADSASSVFHLVLRNAVREKSLSFYVNQINALHSAADKIRFASVRGLRVEDIYYIMTSCEEDLYTSSYLGLYRRLMEHFNDPFADSLFGLVRYDNFRSFMRMAANYNTLADFLSCMPQQRAAQLLRRFVSGIQNDTEPGLAIAMDIADSFTGFSSVAGSGELVQNELRSNLSRCQSDQSFLGIRLYSILLQVFDLVNQKDSLNKLWKYLGNHTLLEHKALLNKKKEVIELVLFYGDEDGVTSFRSFLDLFKNPGKWEVSQNDLWLTIRSLSTPRLIIYANLPLDNKQGTDVKAQDSLFAFLQQQSAEPVILIHRGHSYHLSQTLRRLRPSVKLAILGSCGGNNNILNVANISPAAQIIVSKKIGSKFINDPLIDVINQTLLQNKDLVWTAVWEKLVIRFRNDPFALNLFNEYIPPTKNVSLFVLKLFNFFR